MLQLKNGLADFSQIYPDADKLIINKTMSENSIILKIISLHESISFRAFTPHVFLAALKIIGKF